MNSKPKNQCEDCPARQRDEWHVRGARLRLELRRHHLSLCEMIIAELILDKTFGWQREAVVFPALRFFTDFTGIRESDVVKVLKSLHAMRIISINRIKGAPNYAIREDTESWKVKPRATIATMSRTQNEMREWNGLAPLEVVEEAVENFKNGPQTNIKASLIGEFPIFEHMSGEFPDLF